MVHIKRITLLIIAILMYTLSVYSQREKLYDVNIYGLQQFKDAQKQAKNEDKHIMIQIGGNWCSRCYKFNDFYTKNAILDSLINADYVVIRVNYDKSMKNEQLFAQFDYPQRFSFPVIVICDAEGNRLHTQNSRYSEDGKGSYDKKKFFAFLKNWTVKAVRPESYQKK